MKLAEALAERASLKERMSQVSQRILRNALFQEGDEPAENPNELLSQFEDAATKYERLILRINRTNLAATIESGESLTAALARRDVLMARLTMYRELAKGATPTQQRALKTEIKFRSSVSVRGIQDIADSLSKDHRELDSKIQATNWTTELLD